DPAEAVGTATGPQVDSVQRLRRDQASDAAHQSVPAQARQVQQPARLDGPDGGRCRPEARARQEGRRNFREVDRRPSRRSLYLHPTVQPERRPIGSTDEVRRLETHTSSDELTEGTEGVEVRIGAEPIAAFPLQQTALETGRVVRPRAHWDAFDDQHDLVDARIPCGLGKPTVWE